MTLTLKTHLLQTNFDVSIPETFILNFKTGGQDINYPSTYEHIELTENQLNLFAGL
jgi:hypothetical protein